MKETKKNLECVHISVCAHSFVCVLWAPLRIQFTDTVHSEDLVGEIMEIKADLS